MQKILKISEAVAIGIHACLCLSRAKEGGRLEARDMARQLNVSYDHLSKVLQRLGKAGIVKSVKGPRGGFSLSCSADSLTLQRIYEAIDGPMDFDQCLFGKSNCPVKKCVLGTLVTKIISEVLDYFSNTKISNL